MTRHPASRTVMSGSGLFVIVALALFAIGAAAAQSQLPGTPLTTGPANNLRPSWSPDGSRIAYFSNRSGNNDIWVMDADGASQLQLTTDSADDRRPTWSPDGNWIAFDSDMAGTRDIWLMDTHGSSLRQLTNGPGADSFAAWSPDGTQIAFYSFAGGVTDMWVVSLKDFLQGGQSEQPRRLTTDLADENQNQCTFACHVPAWSPDGSHIAYPGLNHTQIWVVKADGSDAHALTNGDEHDHFPWWTPDGRILFLNEHVNDQQELVNDVYVMDADGGNATLLFADIPHGGPLEFRPDGVTVAFHSPRAGSFNIYTTVLGQQASAATEPAVVATAPAAQTAAVPAPTAAPVGGSAGRFDPALIWVGGVFAVGGVLIAVYLARKR